LRWRRSEKLNYFYAVGIGAVTEFLNGPHRHVVVRIDAGKRIVSPTMRIVLVVWIVVEATRGEERRRIDYA
jgi:hypothetical protein